jgi:hypothetical protein
MVVVTMCFGYKSEQIPKDEFAAKGGRLSPANFTFRVGSTVHAQWIGALQSILAALRCTPLYILVVAGKVHLALLMPSELTAFILPLPHHSPFVLAKSATRSTANT